MFLITAVDFFFKTLQNMIFFLQTVSPCERARMYKLKKEEKKKQNYFEKENRYMNTLYKFAVRLK